MGRTTVSLSDEAADALHRLKRRGDSYDDVVRRLLTDPPKEYRVVCSGCGADGGTYSLHAQHGEPSHCPWCGRPVDGEATDVIAGDEEVTGLTESV